MEKNDEFDIKNFLKICDIQSRTNNAHFNYNRFVEAIIKNDNQTIEETKTYKLLIEMLSNGKKRFKENLSANSKLYRARIIDITDINKLSVVGDRLFGLNKYESKEPPLNKSNEGRNNIAGASYLYLARDPYTAVAECKPFRSSYLSVAIFNTKQTLNIFNFCDNDKVDELQEIQKSEYYMVSKLVENVMRTFYSAVYNDKIGYRVSQYISDLVRKFGYDGMAYKSFISNGKNYTIFNCADTNIEFVESEIVQVIAQHIDIMSLNNGEIVKKTKNFKLPTKDVITDFKKYLIDKINFLNGIDETGGTKND
ncbi:MAG: RES domain-containing protein [Clostridia bacterium]|nr:RES domain-containing protein [Clostridia bacterium]